MNVSESVKAILNAVKEGILIIDKEERVVFANEAYLQFLETEGNLIEGTDLRSFRPNARLPQVVATGKEQRHIARKEKTSEQAYFVNMYPIFENGEIIGGISVIVFLDDAYDTKKVLEEYERYQQDVKDRIYEIQRRKNSFDEIIAVSPNSVAVKELAKRIAATEATVLLQSESGTGKEVYARAICNASRRNKETFLAVNCASVNSSLLESELFGYVGGAFTGAEKKGKIGVFEAARGGTVFLDEISELDVEFQAKLLRVFQEKCIRPVGGIKEIPIDVRIICACNADLKERVEKGAFRKDLYYRLNSFCINIPPLRERREDILAFIDYFLREFSEKTRRNLSITDEAVECLLNHSWPGNVRELRNVLEFGAYLSESGVITRDILPREMCWHSGRVARGEGPTGQAEKAAPAETTTLAEKVRRFEKEEIGKMLEIYGTELEGKKRAAQALGISLASLYNKIK